MAVGHAVVEVVGEEFVGLLRADVVAGDGVGEVAAEADPGAENRGEVREGEQIAIHGERSGAFVNERDGRRGILRDGLAQMVHEVEKSVRVVRGQGGSRERIHGLAVRPRPVGCSAAKRRDRGTIEAHEYRVLKAHVLKPRRQLRMERALLPGVNRGLDAEEILHRLPGFAQVPKLRFKGQ